MQEELKTDNNSLFILFLLILLYNLYFLCVWVHQFFNVIFRVHQKMFKKIKYCKCLRGLKIDDYDRNLKKEKQKRRREERLKKMMDPNVQRAKFVQTVGGRLAVMQTVK